MNFSKFLAISLIFLTFLLPRKALAKSIVETSGDVLNIALPLTALGITFKKKDTVGRYQLTKSLIATVLTTYSLKFLVKEKRPNGKPHSFPSGHTSISFCSATFVHKRYSFALAIPFYLGATFVGYSRIVSKEHHFKDVLVGGLIGFSFSYLFTTKHLSQKTSFISLEFSKNLIIVKECLLF